MPITYKREPELDAVEFSDLLHRSTLGERRPVDDLERLKGMLKNADLIVTARSDDGTLVGVSRAISDFNYCTYLSDLAVDVDFQRRGIGKRLIELTHEMAGLQSTLILLSAPAAKSYYPHVGMQAHESCWIVRGTS
jgi:predicted N-acetyltransferase YhbS